MGYAVLSRSQLQLLVPQLAELAKNGFVAAYEGPGGVYVVVAPRVAAGMSLGSKPVQLVTYISQPTMVLVAGRRWEEGSANACAQALAMQQITARREGTTLQLDPKEVKRLLGEPLEEPTEANDPSAFAPPISKLLGMRTVSLGEGEASIELVAEDHHAGAFGSLHNGVFCDLADLAMGAACKTTLGGDETFITVELKLSFLKQVTRGTFRGDAKVKKRGAPAVLVECNITDEQGSLVAFATSTCIIMK